VVLRTLGGDEFISDLLQRHPLVSPQAFIVVILLIGFCRWLFLRLAGKSVWILLPLVGPVVVALDFNLVVVCKCCLLWHYKPLFLTPPVGFSLFYLKGVAPPGVTNATHIQGVIPFVLLQLLAVLLVFLFPDLVLSLPEVIYG